MTKEEKIFYCANLIIEGALETETIAAICGASGRYTRKVLRKWKKTEDKNAKKTGKKK